MSATKSDISLIGPVCTGKSSLSKLLSEKLGQPQIALDDLRWDYEGRFENIIDCRKRFSLTHIPAGR